MGNSRSQQQQQQQHAGSGSLCLLYLIRRSWRLVSSGGGGSVRAKGPDDTDDCATDLSTASRCSGCKGCGYHQELNFDSESDMAPNAEEDLLVTMPRGSGNSNAGAGPHSAKERLRPPTYNAEDYAIALRRWGRRALAGQLDNSNAANNSNQNTLPSTCTSSSSGYASANPGEMTLRQFTSVSELLNKLRADLRLAFPSFVQEFASAPAEGISLLLETLRGVQLSQSTPPSATGSSRRPRARRAALDELGCVECLAACAERCQDAARILAQAQPGLLALAVCLTNSLNRTRVLALQLLTRVCQTTGGHLAVSEAVSTLRLRYGEGGRFRFLAGALLAPKAAPALRLAGVSFLNAFIGSAPSAQAKLYIQAEACEAGLEPRALQDWLRHTDELELHDDSGNERPLLELLGEEVRKWSRHCVDVDALQVRARRAEESCRMLSKKVSALQRQLQKMQLERINEYNNSKGSSDGKGGSGEVVGKKQEARREEARQRSKSRTDVEKKVSSSAEDEGISFSERSSSPEDQQQPVRHMTSSNNHQIDNDQETTIDDVIEELRIIVKDAEEELHDWNQLRDHPPKPELKPKAAQPQQQPSRARECLRSTEESARMDRGIKSNASLKIVVPGPQQPQKIKRDINANEEEEEDKESAIVPAIIHPQPPRRAPPCLVGNSLFLPPHRHPTTCELATLDQDVEQEMIEACVDSDHEEDLLLLDDDGSDSLLSASRLNYQGPKLLSHHHSHSQQQQSARRRRSSSSAGEFKLESLADFEISETVFDERIAKRSRSSSHPRAEPGNSNSLGSKPHLRCSNTVQRRTERRKYLRRCQSQDHIQEPQDSSSLKSRTSSSGRAVLEQIRKFESMTSFEERRSSPAGMDPGLRRSESFHQTRVPSKESASSRSDGGFAQHNSLDDGRHQQRSSMTKSLDRIDEGLDSMVDIVVTKERRQLCRRLSNDEHLLIPQHQHHRQTKDDRRGRQQQRNEYEELRRKYRSHHKELLSGADERGKYTSFLDGPKTDYQRPNDPRIFANRPHDVLGFSKNRFNAGKYSGNSHPQPPQQQPPPQFASKNALRHASTRGKVTDVVSGLY